MKRNITIAIVLFIVVLTLGGCGGGLTGAGSLEGSVLGFNPQEESYYPFSLATVYDRTDNQTTYTLSDGTYSLDGASSGDHILNIFSPGFTTTYRKVSFSGGIAHVPPAILSPIDSKTTQIGSAGGTATNTGASIKLDIPSGALLQLIDISLTQVNLASAPYEPPLNEYFISIITYISPNNIILSSEATLSIPNLTGLPVGFTEINFYHFNTDTISWEAFDATPQVQDTGEITAKILKFGWLAATLPISPQAGIVEGVIRDAITLNPIAYANAWSSGNFSVADKFGRYELVNIPTGEVTVEASAPHYEEGKGSVNVNPGQTSTLDINLEPLNVGTVYGRVRKSPAGPAISGARVAYSPEKETITDDYGNYTLYDIPPGVATVSAYANGYYANSNSGYLPAGGQVNIDIYLTQSGGSPADWTENFEGAFDWETSSSTSEVIWQVIDNSENIINTFESFGIVDFPDVSGVPYEAHVPNAYDGTHCVWFGEKAIGSYSGPLLNVTSAGGISKFPRVWGYLTSEAIDLTDWAYGTLTLWTWWEIEGVNPGKSGGGTTYDEMLILITTDGGGSWFDVAKLNPLEDPDKDVADEKLPYSSAGHNKPGIWVKHSFDLTPYVGNTIRLFFRFDTKDRLFNGFRGWFLDRLTISPSQSGISSISETSLPSEVHVDSPIIRRR